jgi:circadian clock protein KaiC
VGLLQYHAVTGMMSRTLTVLKTRATDHEAGVREFQITVDGITLVPSTDRRTAVVTE